MSERKQYGMKLDVGLVALVDAALVPGETRTAFVEAALRGRLESPGEVHRLPSAAVLPGTVRRVAAADEIELPKIAARRPVEQRSSLAAVRDRPAKAARLEVARQVKTSAESKAGLLPVDWREKP